MSHAGRGNHMSNPCLLFRTRIMTGAAKLLIVRESATVAEDRQATGTASHSNNKAQRNKAHADSSCGEKTCSTSAHIIEMELNGGAVRFSAKTDEKDAENVI